MASQARVNHPPSQAAPAGLTASMMHDTEAASLAAVAASIEQWWSTERFAHVKRPYTAKQVAAMRQSIPMGYASGYMCDKLYDLLHNLYTNGDYTLTFGALDPVQVAQMAKYVDTIYVSGWQCSSTASTTNEPGPDFADYPMNTVPNKVDQLFRAQLFHDRKQREERSRLAAADKAATAPVDFLRPIIADADTGHGGLPAVMRLTKLMIEAGAAGLHLEDQKPGAKKCGHMGGKVLVSTREHVDRLVAARLQADICGTGTLIVARTDADSANLIDSTIDGRDHPYILGSTNPDLEPLDTLLTRAIAEGASTEAINDLTSKWLAEAGVCRYSEAVTAAIEASSLPPIAKRTALSEWSAAALSLSLPQARKLAASLGFGDVAWDWDAPRTREGYYRIRGGTDFCIARARAFADHADLIWMETSKPHLGQAEAFATAVHKTHPHLMLAYNQSPSFNWDAAGLTDAEIAAFPNKLGKLGFVWQFITLAGFHANSLAITRLARNLDTDDKVLAYVRDVQRKERDEDVETLTHQKWSGAQLADIQSAMATGGISSVKSLGHGDTEAQFRSKL